MVAAMETVARALGLVLVVLVALLLLLPALGLVVWRLWLRLGFVKRIRRERKRSIGWRRSVPKRSISPSRR